MSNTFLNAENSALGSEWQCRLGVLAVIVSSAIPLNLDYLLHCYMIWILKNPTLLAQYSQALQSYIVRSLLHNYTEICFIIVKVLTRANRCWNNKTFELNTDM